MPPPPFSLDLFFMAGKKFDDGESTDLLSLILVFLNGEIHFNEFLSCENILLFPYKIYSRLNSG